MDFQLVVFYFFAAALVLASSFVVFVKNPVHSVLFLVLAFFATAGLWILLEAEFLALILVLVYVGAVMTLFLFVVMMLNLERDPKREGFVRYLPFALVMTLLMLGALFMAIGPHYFGLDEISPPIAKTAEFSNIAALGSVLYTDYFLPFQMAAVLLLVAIISAIMLTLRPSRQKKQDVPSQIATARDQHVRLVSMKPEQPEGSA